MELSAWPIFASSAPAFTGWADVPLNALLLAATALVCGLMNHHVNITRTPAWQPGAIFLLYTGVCWWLWMRADVGSLFGLANALSLFMLFSVLGRRHTSQQVFLSASLWGWGALLYGGMIGYMILFIPILVSLKEATMRDFCAYLVGILAPLWIMAGFGVIDPLRPQLGLEGTIFSAGVHINFAEAIVTGLVALAALALVSTNLVKHFATNLRSRQINTAFAMLAVGSLVLIAVDYPGKNAYLPTLLMSLSFQTSSLLK